MGQNSISPPPNAYNPATHFTSKASAKWGFGTEKRNNTAGSNLSPGPGNYELGSSAFSNKFKFHMGQKLDDGKDKMNVPGAGQYDPDYKAVTKNLPKYSMKARFNTLTDKMNVPGPGQYENHLKNKKDAPKFGFGTSQRPKLTSNDSPGPGHYKINVKVAETAAFAIPGKSEEFKFV